MQKGWGNWLKPAGEPGGSEGLWGPTGLSWAGTAAWCAIREAFSVISGCKGAATALLSLSVIYLSAGSRPVPTNPACAPLTGSHISSPSVHAALPQPALSLNFTL